MSRTISFPSSRRAVAGVTLSAAALSVVMLAACESGHDGIVAPTRSLREGVNVAGQATRTIQIRDHSSGIMRMTDARTWSYSAKLAGQRAIAHVAAGATTRLPLPWFDSSDVAPRPNVDQIPPAAATVAVLARDGGALHVVRQVSRDGVNGTIEIDALPGEPVSRVTVKRGGELLAVRKLQWARTAGGWLLEREELVSVDHGAPAARVTTIYANDDAELARSVASLGDQGRLTSRPAGVTADAVALIAHGASSAVDAAAELMLPTAAWAQTSDPCASKEQAVDNNAWAVFVSAAKLAIDCATENVIGAFFDTAALAGSISSLDVAIDQKNACLEANPTDPHYGT